MAVVLGHNKLEIGDMSDEWLIVVQTLAYALFTANLALWGDYMLRSHFKKVADRGIHVERVNRRFLKRWKEARIHDPSDFGMEASEFEICVMAEQLRKMEGFELAEQHLQHRSYRKGLWDLWVRIKSSTKAYNKAARKLSKTLRRLILERKRGEYPSLTKELEYYPDIHDSFFCNPLFSEIIDPIHANVRSRFRRVDWLVHSERYNPTPSTSQFLIKISGKPVMQTSRLEDGDQHRFEKFLKAVEQDIYTMIGELYELQEPIVSNLKLFRKCMRKLYSDNTYGGTLKGSCDVCRFKLF